MPKTYRCEIRRSYSLDAGICRIWSRALRFKSLEPGVPVILREFSLLLFLCFDTAED